MNKMIAITIRPGATTAADRLICPFACSSPPARGGQRPARRCPATPRTAAAIPGAGHRSPYGPRTPSMKHVVRARERRPQRPRVDLLSRRVRSQRPPPARSRACAGPSVRLTGTLSGPAPALPSTSTQQAPQRGPSRPCPIFACTTEKLGQPLPSSRCRTSGSSSFAGRPARQGPRSPSAGIGPGLPTVSWSRRAAGGATRPPGDLRTAPAARPRDAEGAACRAAQGRTDVPGRDQPRRRRQPRPATSPSP